MKKNLLVLTLMLCTTYSFSQDYKTNFAISTINFELTKFKDGKSVSKICLGVSGGQHDSTNVRIDSTVCELVNDIDKQLFTNAVLALFKKISDSAFNARYTEQVALIADKKFDELTKEETTTEIIFGRDKYYGLTDSEIADYLKKLNELKYLHEELTVYKINNRTQRSNAAKANVTKSEKGSEGKSGKIDTLKAKILLKRAELSALANLRKYQISLIGNANAVSSFKTVERSQLNAGFGIMANKPAHSEFIGILTVAQVNDTVVGTLPDFGASVLVPGVRRFSLLTSYRLNSLFPFARNKQTRKIGLVFNANITPYNWVIKKTGENSTQDSLSVKTIPSSCDLMFSYNWGNVYEEDKDVSISYDLGFTTRFIGGNITKAERQSFLGNERKFYTGIITGLNIKYNGLRVQFYAPYIFGKRVNGLTNGQVYASIGFIGTILNSAASILKKKNDNTISDR